MKGFLVFCIFICTTLAQELDSSSETMINRYAFRILIAIFVSYVVFGLLLFILWTVHDRIITPIISAHKHRKEEQDFSAIPNLSAAIKRAFDSIPGEHILWGDVSLNKESHFYKMTIIIILDVLGAGLVWLLFEITDEHQAKYAIPLLLILLLPTLYQLFFVEIRYLICKNHVREVYALTETGAYIISMSFFGGKKYIPYSKMNGDLICIQLRHCEELGDIYISNANTKPTPAYLLESGVSHWDTRSYNRKLRRVGAKIFFANVFINVPIKFGPLKILSEKTRRTPISSL